jgi:putative serine protease PepD
MHPSDAGDGGDGEDGAEFRPPLPPEDRIWRHPSEVTSAGATGRARPAPSGRRRPRTAGLVVASGLVGATLSLAAVAAMGGLGSDVRVVERSVAVPPVDAAEDGSVGDLVDRTRPSVAAVRAEHDGSATSASALVLRSDGHLLTNAHVVDGADSVEVRLHDGSAVPATVVGLDPLTDLAVLRVDADLRPAVLGTAEGTDAGDRVVVVGVVGPSGRSTDVVTGRVRGLDRRLQLEDGTVLHGMIVLDVSLIDGVDGGPLLDGSGAVIGITTDATRAAANVVSTPTDPRVASATPIDLARRIGEEILEHGQARHAWLGVSGADLDPDAAIEMGIAGGAEVTDVVPRSPAEQAGVEEGDVVVAVAGRPVGSMSDLIARLREYEPGDPVELTLRREDGPVKTTAVLIERP